MCLYNRHIFFGEDRFRILVFVQYSGIFQKAQKGDEGYAALRERIFFLSGGQFHSEFLFSRFRDDSLLGEYVYRLIHMAYHRVQRVRLSLFLSLYQEMSE